MTRLIEVIAQGAVLFAFFSAVLFIAGYSLLAPWWRSEIGWARVSLDFGIAVALSPTFLHAIFGIRVDNSIAFAWYAIGSIFFVGFVSLWNLAIVVRTQIRGPHDRTTTHRNTRPPG